MLPVITYNLPTHLPVGPVNTYLILSSPFTLIDAGPHNSEALDILLNDFHSRGITGKIERIILTHAHGDHAGLTDLLQELTGAQVFLHKHDLEKIRRGFWKPDPKMLNKFALPESEANSLIADFTSREMRHSLKLPNVNVLDGNENFHFEDFVLSTIHTPGHSPGSICLYEPVSGSMFAGDLLLANITPNPVIESDGEGNWQPNARTYLTSLETILQKEIHLVYPGHGEPFRNGAQVAKQIIANYAARKSDVDQALDYEHPQTVYAIVNKIYPQLHGFQLFLAISKILGIIDLMIAANNPISIEETEGIVWIRKHKS